VVGTTNFDPSGSAVDSHSGGDPFGFAEAVNLLSTYLDGSLSAVATTITVDDTTGFPTRGILVLGQRSGFEVIPYAGKTSTSFTGAVRGSGARAHANGRAVSLAPTAANHNDLAAAIVAVERAVSKNARKNRLINGSFNIKQRLTLGSADDTYVLDRWVLLLEASSAAAAAQETSDVPTDGANTGLRLTVGSGEDNKFGVVQILKAGDCKDLRGKTVSLQLKMKATAGIGDVRAAVIEWTSTADSVTSDVVGTWGAALTNPTLATNWAYCSGYTPVSLAPTTSWAKYKIEGVSIGASANNVAVLIWCDDESTTVTTDILRITDVQLEEGPVCTNVERRPEALERLLCQHYYFEMAPGADAKVFGFGEAYNTTDALVQVILPCQMRTTPTLSVSAVGDFALATAGFALTTSPASITLYSYQHNIAVVWPTGGGATLTAGQATMLLSDSGGGATARLMFDAEL